MDRIEIEKLDNQGRGICYLDDKITFVKNALPGEIVDVEITKISKKYQEAKVVEYIKKSDSRVELICPFYNTCDGCNLMHMTYEDTIKYKKEKVKSILYKYAMVDTDVDIIDSKDCINYRNKISLKIVNGKIGYYSEKSHHLNKITSCLLASKCINDLLEDIDAFDISNGSIVIRNNINNELLISINTSDDIKIDYGRLLKKHKIAGVIVNKKRVFGNTYFYDYINGLKFKVSYDSFFQINIGVISKIFTRINELIKKQNSIIDLYCGVGTLGINVSKNTKELYGVEIVENAIIDAKENALLNGITNSIYYCGKVENLVHKLPKQADCIIVDPPREGLDVKTVNYIINSKCKKVVYISCDPITLARDLKDLKEYYDIKLVEAYDMFPYTYHVECVSVLHRKTLEK